MVKRYPYELWVQVTGPSTRNGDGITLPGQSAWVKRSLCRDETNNSGELVNLEDGTSYRYNALIQLPKGCPPVPKGASIEVRESDGQVRVKGKAKRFSPDQLHARLWV